MGHVTNPERTYRLLQQRLDRTVTGAPASPTLINILKLLFRPEEAELARHLPGRPTSLEDLSGKLDIPPEKLRDQLNAMVQRGVVLDIQHRDKQYFLLPPIVIGFFEFTFMRARDDMPLAELARLFDTYMREEDKFARSVFAGETQLGRSLVREEALPEDDHTEILDWERASYLVSTASTVGVSICACRHKAGHLGHACEAPQRACLSLNHGAETLIRNGSAERITTQEGMQILEQCKEAGLAQTGDNVKKQVSYICNCCGCCCGMMEAVRVMEIRNAIVTSNWIMSIDADQCRGCGKCANACPVRAIALKDAAAPKKKLAELDESLCLGCGVCHSSCKFDAMRMRPRPKRVMTPEDIFDRVARMAIERGKLADLIFETPEGLHYRALGRVLSILENSPPVKAALAIKPLRSAFLNALISKYGH